MELLLYTSNKKVSREISRIIEQSFKNTVNLSICSDKDKAFQFFTSQSFDVYLIYDDDPHLSKKFLITAINKGCRMPTIYMSDKYNKEIDKELLDAGVTDFILRTDLSSESLEKSLRHASHKWKMIRQLESQQNKYTGLIEGSSEYIFTLGTSGQISNTNPSFNKNLGRENKIGSFWELIDIDSQDMMRLQKKLDSKESINGMEVLINTQYGKKKRCLLSLVPIGISDQANSGFQGILHDITERYEMENQLRFSEKLSMTGRIARLIGHEVRNPLTNIKLSIDEMKEDILSDEDADYYFDIIIRNVDRIENLVASLLLSAQSAELVRKSTSIPRLIGKTLKLCEDRVSLLETEIRTIIPDGLPKIEIDTSHFKLALLNILVNALEVVPPKEGIVVIGADFHSHNKEVEIYITDNGPGISKEVKEQMFDPYFSAKDGGTGLGLTSAKSIISLHNGKIEVDSKIGAGTTFRIFLPVVE